MNANPPRLDILVRRLNHLQFSKGTIEAVLAASRSSDSLETVIVHARRTLEMLFRDTSDLARLYRGVSFQGDRNSFGQLRNFVHSQEWLTEVESGFVNGYYKLLSDSGVHPGRSLIDSEISVQILLYIAELVASRITAPLKRRPHLGVHDSARRNRIVTQFLVDLRQRRYSSRALQIEFDNDLMNLARDRLRRDDAPFLFDLIRDQSATPDLRARCASLFLCPRTAPPGRMRAQLVGQLERYYWQDVATNPWQVSRAIALALANRANNMHCILNFIDRIEGDPELREANLARADSYYGDETAAFNYYLGPLNNSNIPTEGCVWEAYYLSQRFHNCKATADILRKRLKLIEEPGLRAFWQRIANRVVDDSRQKT
jgi:hypothetical protein